MASRMENLMLRDYQPGKYALHSRFQDVYPGYAHKADVSYLRDPSFFREYGTEREGLEAYYVPSLSDIVLRRNRIFPREPQSLDAKTEYLGDLLRHEGWHHIYADLPPRKRFAMGRMMEETAPEAMAELFWRGYIPKGPEKETRMDYIQRLSNEYIAHLVEPAPGFHVEDPYWQDWVNYAQGFMSE